MLTHAFACEHPVFPAPFVENTALQQVECIVSFP